MLKCVGGNLVQLLSLEEGDGVVDATLRGNTSRAPEVPVRVIFFRIFAIVAVNTTLAWLSSTFQTVELELGCLCYRDLHQLGEKVHALVVEDLVRSLTPGPLRFEPRGAIEWGNAHFHAEVVSGPGNAGVARVLFASHAFAAKAKKLAMTRVLPLNLIFAFPLVRGCAFICAITVPDSPDSEGLNFQCCVGADALVYDGTTVLQVAAVVAVVVGNVAAVCDGVQPGSACVLADGTVGVPADGDF